ncbi:MAG: hypothetical protein CO096_35580 [Armatimonadetes bacterium CG_4_9_14_3_um_filter_66_14]|nr:MAG: hypothetical protein COS65_30385 [Armatimonadetes bacterium CG06_land_8_20_14_3_00_66_21]PJB60110.1 MAG: hypothetical protein CO096_35580 [Armatimonadetes bacterium CG_4_9_14_3_um_filter_66_14]
MLRELAEVQGAETDLLQPVVHYLREFLRLWSEADRAFFGASGERAQRERGEKVGDIQAIGVCS